MAATFIPSSGHGIAFERPIARVGSVLLCGFGQQDECADRLADAPYLFNGLRARYLPDVGQAVWEDLDWFNFPISSRTYATAHDDRLMRSPRLLDVLLGLQDLASRTVQRTSRRQESLALPPTLIGYLPDDCEHAGEGVENADGLTEHFLKHPTAYVQQYAESHGLSIAQAWQAIDSETHVPGDVEMTGLRLIDARLCADSQMGTRCLSRVMSVYLDMRPLLGRRYTNPARKLPGMLAANPASGVIKLIGERRGDSVDPGQWSQCDADIALALMRERLGPRHVFFDDYDLSEALVAPDNPVRVNDFDRDRIRREHGDSAVARGLRRLLSRDISNGCEDQGLVDAYNNPGGPLVAGRIANRQVW